MDELRPPYDLATSGASIIRYSGHVEIPSLETKKFEFNIAETFQKDERFQSWRGHIINNSLFVEEKLEDVISKIFVKESMAEHFHSIVIGREFFTFMSKWKVFKDITDSISPHKEKDYAQLKTNLLEVINVRDKFAHGKVSYSGDKGEKIILNYFKGEPKTEEIDERTISTFVELVKKCLEELNKFISEIR